MYISLSAQFYYNEPCTGATGQFVLHGDAVYTAATGVDPVGNGWLRLTPASESKKGYVVFDQTFPSTMGVTIEFDFKVWTPSPCTWGIADGFSVFLFNGAPGLPFQIGESGGALGYSFSCQSCSGTGLSNAYVGVGIDEYGNFSSTWNCSSCSWSPGTNAGSNQIAIRGPAPSYAWISGSGSNLGSLNAPILYSTNTPTRPADNIYYRRVRIDMIPNADGIMEINAYIRLQPNTEWQPIIGPVLITTPPPDTFGMGFAGVTGGGCAIHEVRNLIARTPGDLYVYMPFMPCLNVNPNDTTTIPIHVVNGLGAADSIRVCDTLPANFNLIEEPTATATNGTVIVTDFTQTILPDGRQLCCYLLEMSSYDEVIMTYIGNFDASSHVQSFTVGSTITLPPGNFVDFDTTDNYFTTTIPLVGLDTVTICYGETYTQGEYSYTESGDYMLVYKAVTDCDSVIYLHLTVSEAAYFDLGEDVTICNGDITYLHSNYDKPHTFYYWNTGVNTPDIRVVSEGTYALYVETWVEDSTVLCRHSDTVRVISSPYPVADFGAYPTEGCTPFKVQFTNLTDWDNHVHNYDDIIMSYLWEVYDEAGTLHFTSQEENPEFEFIKQGNYHVQLTTTTNTGCKDTIVKEDFIIASLQPHAEFMSIPETQFLSDSGIYFLNFTDTNILTNTSVWYWDFGDGTTDSTTHSPTHRYEEWGDYVVTFFVSNSLGCHDQISHSVSIESDLKFPNVITPNGDGLNDVFAIEDMNTSINPDDPEKFRTNLLSIFDRWGRKVYEAKNYDTFTKNGDITVGKKAFDGKNCPDGTYYYTFYYKGKLRSININGTLMILRNSK